MVFDEKRPIFVPRNSICRKTVAFRETRQARSRVWFARVLLLSMFLTPQQLLGDESYPLTPDLTAPARRAKVILEVDGKLKVNPDGKQVHELPLKVRGELDYDERTVSWETDSQLRRDVRYYRKARAVIEVGDAQHQAGLRSEQRLVVAKCDRQEVSLHAPLGPLTRDEFELVNVPANGALLHLLLPAEPVQVGDSWQHSNELMASLLLWDSVHQNDCRSELREIRGEVAILDLAGTLSGAVAGITSDIELKGVYNFDRQQRRITWLALSLKEQRAIGHAEPGFEVEARLRLATTSKQLPPELTDAALADLQLDGEEGTDLLSFQSQGGFQFLHGRDWRVMVDRQDVSILRLVEQGDLIAQCNASTLDASAPGAQLDVKAFESDVKRALGERFGRIEETTLKISESGIRVLRTVVSGIDADVPIQWIYYHLSNEHGKQAAVVFTLDAKLVEQFGGQDQILVSSFLFEPSTTPVGASAE